MRYRNVRFRAYGRDMSTDDTTTSDVWVPPWWEPPLAGTEVEHLLGALGRMRATFRWKADGLGEAGLRERLLKELAAVERAEARVVEGTYGLSVESGEPIPDARLEAIPWRSRSAITRSRSIPPSSLTT